MLNVIKPYHDSGLGSAVLPFLRECGLICASITAVNMTIQPMVSSTESFWRSIISPDIADTTDSRLIIRDARVGLTPF